MGKQNRASVHDCPSQNSGIFSPPPPPMIRCFFCVFCLFFFLGSFCPSTNVLDEEGVSMFSNKSKLTHFYSCYLLSYMSMCYS